mmetsp:Transcript_31857/g.49861  ORF Transcript_31857/g.49861 Transcript_31857/m.49861 type:complete len:221 (-) Transcript_31857:89-751(-)
MIVICFEGCHGSGKSSLCNEFESGGFNVLDEAFMDMPSYDIHPQSFVMENLWVCRWIKRLLRKQIELGDAEKNTVFFADRSPFSAVFYSQSSGLLLKSAIAEQLNYLREKAGIVVYTVYLKVPQELLWERIQTRLRREPHRLKYNEDSREWMESTVGFYEEQGDLWDFVFENSSPTIKELSKAVQEYLSEKVDGFEDGLVCFRKGTNTLPIIERTKVGVL